MMSIWQELVEKHGFTAPTRAWQSSTKIWAQLHEHSFRRLGGATATVVLDNLREGVITPDVEPLLNPLYRDVLAHYGVAV